MNQAPAFLALIPALLLGAPAVGQIVINNTTPGTYIDISATGTPLSLSDDGEVDITTTVGNALLAAGTVRVGANGAVRFDGAGQSLSFANQPIPSTSAFSGDRTLMPFWDDIDIDSGLAGEIYWQEIAGTLIIQWQDAEFYPGGGDTTTFQLQVHSTGQTFAQFLYQDVLQPRADGGGSATIGFQAGLCSPDNFEWSYNISNSVVDGDVLSVTGTAPPPPQANEFVIVDTLPGTYMDISATGTPLSISDDGGVDILTTVGNSVLAAGTVRVGSNGGVRFGGSGTSLGVTNATLPSTSAFSGDQTLLPFWDDIDTDSGQDGQIYWQEIGGTLIIQWQDAAFYPGGGDTATFQLQVHSSGPALAQFLYQDILQPRANGGESATIGYQGRPCLDGDFQWSFNTAGAVTDGDVLSLLLGGSSVGQNYCLSVANSTGSAALISGSGSTSVAANNLVLAAGPVPNQTGIFYYGPMTAQQVFGNGFRCVGGIVARLDVTLATGNIMVTTVDNTDPPNASGQITVGSTFHFQCWYRDPAAGGTFFNLSDGLTVTFDM